LGHGRLRSWLLTAPILALDAVGPSTPTILNKSAGDPTNASAGGTSEAEYPTIGLNKLALWKLGCH
jgi:hypothetical protein